MIKSDNIINEAISLPVEIKTKLINKLLQSINPAKEDIDKLWADESEIRVKEIEDGKVKLLPGEKVFSNIRKKLKK